MLIRSFRVRICEEFLDRSGSGRIIDMALAQIFLRYGSESLRRQVSVLLPPESDIDYSHSVWVLKTAASCVSLFTLILPR